MRSYKFWVLALFCLGLVLSCATGKYRSGSSASAKAMYLPIGKYYLTLDTGNSKINKAARLVRSKHFKKAHEVLSKMIKEKDNPEGAYYFKAYVYMLQQKYDLARYMFDKVKKEEDYQPAIYNNLGIISLFEGEKEDALYFFNKAIDLDSYSYPALINRGMLYLESGLYELAYNDLEIAVELNPSDDDLMLAYGLTLKGLGEYDDAKEIFSRLIGSQEGMYNLGLVYYENLHDYKNALKVFRKYISSGPKMRRGDMAKLYLRRSKEKLSKE